MSNVYYKMENKIKNYSYQSVDDSILAPYYKKICNILINFIPSHYSPNVVTLLGLVGIFLSTLIVVFLKNIIGHFYTCIICSILLFYYQLMDTLDGMQGRRVNMYYNPTTELFDHGCDSITSACVLYNLLNLTNLLNNNFVISVIFVLLSFTNFFLPTWQHSNTGIMHFRKGIANPTESIFMIKILFILIGYSNDLFQNIYVILFGLFTLAYFTVVNLVECYRDTFDNNKKSYYNKYISLTPLFLTYIYALFLISFYNSEINYLNIVAPFLISILNLIWYEISDNNYDILSVIIIIIVNIFNFTLGNYFFVIYYILTFKKYSRVMCNILNMKHFYSVNI